MNTKTAISMIAALTLGAAAIVFAACSDDNSTAVKEPSPDAGQSSSSGSSGTGTSSGGTSSGGTSSGGTSGGPGDCVQNPTTHLEIINACTNATKFAKNPTLPMLLPDGGLPPLN
jgi:hypothetical protein